MSLPTILEQYNLELSYDYSSKLGEQYDYIENLEKENKNALKWYMQLGDYETLNRLLRQDRQREFSKELEDIFFRLESIFEGVNPINNNIIVYRGSEYEILDSKSYVSTSRNIDKALYFATCCMYIITVSSGSKVLPIEYVHDQEEEEILLNRGGNFVITNTKNVKFNYKNKFTNSDELKYLKFIFVTYLPEGSVKINTNSNIKKIADDMSRQQREERLIFLSKNIIEDIKLLDLDLDSEDDNEYEIANIYSRKNVENAIENYKDRLHITPSEEEWLLKNLVEK